MPMSTGNRQAWFNIGIGVQSAIAVGTSIVKSTLSTAQSTKDLFLCLVDHYEPQVGKPPAVQARERVEDWLRRYPRIAGRHRDSDGRVPAHSFFYPWDEYNAWELRRLAEMCAAGYGEIELHLHHRDDTEDSLRKKLREAICVYRGHGVLSTWENGQPAWGFIHGNWALANSRCDNGRNYCGVNNEIQILQEEGCYADFTFPAWQQFAQPRQLNSIYYAGAASDRPKSYDTGLPARANQPDTQGLLLIQGALSPFFARNGAGWRFAMDDSDLASYRRYHPDRLDRWVRAGIHVAGRPDCVFVKLHCHGAEDRNRAALLGEDLQALFIDAEARYNDGKRYRLHYVTAREMFNIVKAMEAGVRNVAHARDYVLPSPNSVGAGIVGTPARQAE